ncbi:transposase, partial [Desulfobulbus rhabdoformis]|nr:transposase [Desulfobulbus rhabdoformis]
MSTFKNFIDRNRKATQTLDKIKMRSHLNADALFAHIREDLQKVPDHRAANASIPLEDALMSGFAMFSLKDPSLLSFDGRRLEQPESLHGVFGVRVIPSDTQMRTILDEIVPTLLRRPFRTIFHQLQRGKVMP